MAIWTFRDYISPTGVNDVRPWCDELSVKAQARLDAILEHMGAMKSWGGKEFKRLSGDAYQGLGEIRFNDGGVPHRLIGTNGPGKGEYTFLIGCTHKDKVYDPPNAMDTAAQRRKQLESGKASTSEH